MNYIPPFHLLAASPEAFGEGAGQHVTFDDFRRVIRNILSSTIAVDEEWYLRRYEDVAQVIADDPSRTAREHFYTDGYFEGRLPFRIVVDERWYLTNNPDVAEGVRKGRIESGQQHFEMHGYREGRLPFKV